MQAQLQNQAGAALVRHIKWWQHCFFRCLNLASQKDGTFDILSRCQANSPSPCARKLAAFGCVICHIYSKEQKMFGVERISCEPSHFIFSVKIKYAPSHFISLHKTLAAPSASLSFVVPCSDVLSSVFVAFSAPFNA